MLHTFAPAIAGIVVTLVALIPSALVFLAIPAPKDSDDGSHTP